MITIDVSSGGYPVFIRLLDESGNQLASMRHTELLKLEHAVAEAKRKVLCALDQRDWHEVDPKLAGVA